MDPLIAVATFYVLLVGTLLFLLLFGEHEAFEHTLVSRAHFFLTVRVGELFSACIVRACGRPGAACLDASNELCCERPNPALQCVYLALVGGGYAVWLHAAQRLIPGPFAGEVHAWIGPAAASAGLLSFVATSFSDPGVITSHNVDIHLAAQPFDHVLHVPKTCPVLRIPAPARSKFSRTTRRRVARFDHYCGWMANDIGERNHRWFISFLVLNAGLCAYGCWLSAAMIAGDMAAKGVLDATVWVKGVAVPLRSAPGSAAQWAILTHPPLATLCLFLGLTFLLVSSFGGYHLYLAATNCTTNEAWKRKDLRRELVDASLAAEAEAEAEAEEASAAGARAAGAGGAEQLRIANGSGGGGASSSSSAAAAAAAAAASAGGGAPPPLWRRRLRRPWAFVFASTRGGKPRPGRTRESRLPAETRAAIDVHMRNFYDKGIAANLWEVAHPRSCRAAARAGAGAADAARKKRE